MAQLAFDNVLPRYEEENFYNYSPLEQAERTQALRTMAKDYPTLPRGWLEMVYDFCQNKPSEELNTIINSKKWERNGKFNKNEGGIIKCMEVLSLSEAAIENEDGKLRYKGIHGLDGEFHNDPSCNS